MKSAVTASTREAAGAGAEVLRAGGNAVDAAIAAALATCVADPANCGIGGYGGYLVVHDARNGARCVQFPLWAPARRTPASLARAYPEEGPECSSVPNVVGGLARASSAMGRLAWSRVSEPAIRLAREGVVANANTRRAFEQNRHRRFMAECFEIHDDDARGLVFRQPALAATFERMAEAGPGWFYEGPLGDAACRAFGAAGVDVSLADWRGEHEAVELLDAARFEVDGTTLFASTLGLSGSACVFATFAAASRLGGEALATARGQAELASAMAGIWRHRFGAGAGNDFAGVEIARWVEEALAGAAGGAIAPSEAAHTAHLNVADASGMVAALTATHGPAWFGGRWAIPGSGVVMNGGMHNFTRPSLVRRGERWIGVSNMSPTVAGDAGGNRVVLGGPGARRIPSNIALVLARHLVAAAPLQRAVSAGRFHAEDRARAFYEAGRTDTQLVEELAGRFPAVEPQSGDDYFGPLTAIRVSVNGRVEAAVDDRDAKGYAEEAS